VARLGSTWTGVDEGASDVELFVMKPNGKDLTRLTQSPGEDGGPRMRHLNRPRGREH